MGMWLVRFVGRSYQRAGIGTQIIIESIKHLRNVTYSEHFCLEGAALLNSCVRKKIIEIPDEMDEE